MRHLASAGLAAVCVGAIALAVSSSYTIDCVVFSSVPGEVAAPSERCWTASFDVWWGLVLAAGATLAAAAAVVAAYRTRRRLWWAAALGCTAAAASPTIGLFLLEGGPFDGFEQVLEAIL